jgi:xanthine dehydrogenase accessory factor
MKEFQKITDVYSKVDFTQRKAALATVVRVDGSAYRRPGARMLMTDDGRWEGAISGGCLEGDALRKARQVITDGKPMLVTYDTMDDDANSLGVGLGCNGIIDVLIEPIQPEAPDNPIHLLTSFLEKKKKAVMATVFSVSGESRVRVGDRLMFHSTGEVLSRINDSEVYRFLLEETAKVRDIDKSGILRYEWEGVQFQVFMEVLHPSIHLVIFGGGYDAIPVTRMAREIGWQVTVTDDCIAHLAPARFPSANAVVHADRNAILEKIPITPYTAAVLMSHNYKYDLAVLDTLLGTDIRFIGILGPRKRTEKMFSSLTDSGKTLNPEMVERVHSPIGLDIGAETPDEIAVAIIAEVQAVFSGRLGGLLKDRPGPIHERDSVPV